ncbi:MAG: hypothetical protein M1836_003263 [Candelina mexicana]|nr:MAG: hypothetical protein M1836_003263 [Candelina mexicana]
MGLFYNYTRKRQIQPKASALYGQELRMTFSAIQDLKQVRLDDTLVAVTMLPCLRHYQARVSH